jgi:hypothetical protein
MLKKQPTFKKYIKVYYKERAPKHAYRTPSFFKLKKRGFFEGMSGQQINVCAGYTFDPISVPDPEEFSKGLEQMREYLPTKEE